MQNPISDQTPMFVLLPVPFEALEEADIGIGDLLQFTATDGKLIMERVNPQEVNFVCDGDCDNCPVSETDCNGDCADCPCNDTCDESEVF